MRALPLLLLVALAWTAAAAQTFSTTDEPAYYPYPDLDRIVGLVEVIEPESEAGVFAAGTCMIWGRCPLPGDEGFGPLPLVLARDPGRADGEGDPGEGCARLDPSVEAAGAAVLYRRPDGCTAFATMWNAAASGATAVVIHQDERVPAGDDEALWNIDWGYTTAIDRVGMTLTRYRGERLRAALERGEEVLVVLRRSNVPVAAEESAEAPEVRLRVAPNPVRGRAVVRYGVAEAGPVRLAVYDALGREAAVLVDGARAAGEHAAVLDARPLAPGLYVARLVAGEHTAAVRFTVAR